ncbi:hypothetical protein AU467_20265 [Mesorhizobium loti]|uniref:Uncharacterized protein n=1 Tax=Rhizobium loti TaxID=381 RepID=A0A101KTK9_RHILI|nr:hypothetical protein AU467_20265 [Mesorhizobium loti]
MPNLERRGWEIDFVGGMGALAVGMSWLLYKSKAWLVRLLKTLHLLTRGAALMDTETGDGKGTETWATAVSLLLIVPLFILTLAVTTRLSEPLNTPNSQWEGNRHAEIVLPPR